MAENRQSGTRPYDDVVVICRGMRQSVVKALTSAVGPGCVKTQTPGPIAQQLNREGRVDESLLRQSAASRFNISSWSPENRFYTAWVITGSQWRPRECRLSGAKRKSISGDWMSVHSQQQTLPLPKEAEHWSLTTLREKLITRSAPGSFATVAISRSRWRRSPYHEPSSLRSCAWLTGLGWLLCRHDGP